jgi:hypothetical protein
LEYVANSLSVSYLKQFLPNIYTKTKSLLDALIISNESKFDSDLEILVNSLFDSNYKILNKPTYNLSPNKMFIVHIFMMKKIYENDISFDTNMGNFFLEM